MFLGSGKSIAEKIELLMREPVNEPIRLAVAFWGSRADKKISRSCQIICDLGSGACDPEVIRKLRQRTNCTVRNLSRLHAKVVIGSEGAIVSSANMSANGLGPQSGEESGTIEAGCYIPNRSPEFTKITAWFEVQWQGANEISESDLLEAKKRWDLRQQNGRSAQESDQLPSGDVVPLDPFSLLQAKIAKGDRLRATKPQIFEQISLALPGIDPRRQGKIASWACHLLLSTAGLRLTILLERRNRLAQRQRSG